MKKDFKENLLPCIICNIVTFTFVFRLIPLVCKGAPDYIWISARIVFAAAAATLLRIKNKNVTPFTYFIASLTQDFMAVIFQKPIAGLQGMGNLSGIGGFEYFGSVYMWITGITFLQVFVIAIVKYTEK